MSTESMDSEVFINIDDEETFGGSKKTKKSKLKIKS